MNYTTRELTKDEGDALTKDLQAVLEKHGAELGVVSTISLMKRIETPEGELSPLSPSDVTRNDTNTSEAEHPTA